MVFRSGRLAAYQESLDIRRKLAAHDPSNAQALGDLAVGLYNMSTVVDPAQTRAALTEALSILEKLDQEHKLTAEQTDLLDMVRSALSKLVPADPLMTESPATSSFLAAARPKAKARRRRSRKHA